MACRTALQLMFVSAGFASACVSAPAADPSQETESGGTGSGGMSEGSDDFMPGAGTSGPTTGSTDTDASPTDTDDLPMPPDAGGPGATGDVYFIATDGSDANPGTLDEPFATFEFAIDALEAGDTLYARGGVYLLDHVIEIDKSGAPGNPIYLWAYEGEEPILDFSNNPRHANPPQPRDDDSIAATRDAVGLLVSGDSDWWHVRGLTIRHAAYYGVRVYGSNNVFEQLVIHDSKAAGLEITGKEGWSPSDNLVVDCDSFHNFDPQTNGEDADGFAAKFDTLGPGNVFRGTRAWSNSDDGYDFWHAAPVLLEYCWSFDNGYNRPEWSAQLTGSWQGDGMGFKLGQEAGEIELHHVAAWGNKGFGIDDNGNGSAGGVTVHNATLVNNANNGNPTQLSLDDGRPHTVHNTVAFDLDGSDVTSLDAPVEHAFNSWNGMAVTTADFIDIDLDALFLQGTGPRGPDAALPDLGLRLAPGSALVDAGTDVGLPYAGDAPDLGAFETAP